MGAAYYRDTNWSEAVAALEKSAELGKGGGAFDWFYLAMAYAQLGHPAEARRYVGQATEWTEKHKPRDAELRYLRAETAALLGIADDPKDAYK